MNFSDLSQHFTLIVTLACLVIGYVIKHATFLKWVPNGDIPVILAIIGGVSNVIVAGLSFESVIYGALMGIASTGLYEAFTNFVEGSEE